MKAIPVLCIAVFFVVGCYDSSNFIQYDAPRVQQTSENMYYVVNIYTVKRENITSVKKMWNYVDENALEKPGKETLRKNGLQIGICKRSNIDLFWEKLQEAPIEYTDSLKIVKSRKFENLVGAINQKNKALFLDDKGLLVVKRFQDAQFKFNITSSPVEGKYLSLRIVPVIVEQASGASPYYFDNLAVDVIVEAGQPVVIGPYGNDTDNLGSFFYSTSPDGSQWLKFAVIFPAVN